VCEELQLLLVPLLTWLCKGAFFFDINGIASSGTSMPPHMILLVNIAAYIRSL
jgi:hypothetical protein